MNAVNTPTAYSGISALVWQYDRVFAVILGVIYLLILAALSSAVKGIFTVALYRYATGGQVPYGFTADSFGAIRRPS